MLVIGFGYKARQGKNTAALAMLNSCPLDTEARLYAFADTLKTEVRVACSQFGGQFGLIQTFKEQGLMPEWVHVEDDKPRSLLQWWGTEFRRAADPDYWVKKLRKTLQGHDPEVAFITDVRFPNEIEMIHSLGGVVVNVTRTTAPDVKVHAHPSECALDGATWDYELSAATKPELDARAAALYLEIVKQHVSLPGS